MFEFKRDLDVANSDEITKRRRGWIEIWGKPKSVINGDFKTERIYTHSGILMLWGAAPDALPAEINSSQLALQLAPASPSLGLDWIPSNPHARVFLMYPFVFASGEESIYLYDPNMARENVQRFEKEKSKYQQ